MVKLPEELQGIITEKQWNDLCDGKTIKLGAWRVSVLTERGDISFTSYMYYLDIMYQGQRKCIVNYDAGTSSEYVRAIYAGLQLIVRDPEFLRDQMGKFPNACLDLRV